MGLFTYEQIAQMFTKEDGTYTYRDIAHIFNDHRIFTYWEFVEILVGGRSGGLNNGHSRAPSTRGERSGTRDRVGVAGVAYLGTSRGG
jgi:hypothetical protein